MADRDLAAEATRGTGNLPEFTVVIPVHNGENFLFDTLTSVLAQIYPAKEVIVVNDNSTDGTAAIAESFGDKVKLVNRAHEGVSASRNYGISIASTEWIALMDHDDLWEGNHLLNLANVIARDPDADICYSGRRHMLLNPSTGLFETGDVIKVAPPEKLWHELHERCAFMPSCVAIRRSKVMKIGGFDRRHMIAQDWELWLRLIHDGAKFVHSPEPSLLYRVHAAAVTNKPLIALSYSRRVVEQSVLPYLSVFRRATHGRRLVSRLESQAAVLMRENGMEGALKMMMRSLIRHPFHTGNRYKIAAHMLIHGYKTTNVPAEISGVVTNGLPPLESRSRETR